MQKNRNKQVLISRHTISNHGRSHNWQGVHGPWAWTSRVQALGDAWKRRMWSAFRDCTDPNLLLVVRISGLICRRHLTRSVESKVTPILCTFFWPFGSSRHIQQKIRTFDMSEKTVRKWSALYVRKIQLLQAKKVKRRDAKQMTQWQCLLLVLHHIMISYSLFPLVLLPLLFYKFSTSCWDDLQDGLIFFMSIWDLMFKMWPEYKDFVYSNFRTNLKNLWRATHVCRWIVKHTVMIEDSWRCCGQRLIRRILFHGTCRKRKRSWNEISMMASTYSLSLWISMLRERSTRLSRSRCFGIVFTKRSTADPSVRPALPKRKSVQVPQPTIDYSEYALSMHTMSYLTLIEIDWSSIHSNFQALAKPVSR